MSYGTENHGIPNPNLGNNPPAQLLVPYPIFVPMPVVYNEDGMYTPYGIDQPVSTFANPTGGAPSPPYVLPQPFFPQHSQNLTLFLENQRKIQDESFRKMKEELEKRNRELQEQYQQLHSDLEKETKQKEHFQKQLSDSKQNNKRLRHKLEVTTNCVRRVIDVTQNNNFDLEAKWEPNEIEHIIFSEHQGDLFSRMKQASTVEADVRASQFTPFEKITNNIHNSKCLCLEQKTVEFQGGNHGIIFAADGVVQKVDADSQAAQLGINVNWQAVNLGNEEFSRELLDDVRHSKEPFSITFQWVEGLRGVPEKNQAFRVSLYTIDGTVFEAAVWRPQTNESPGFLELVLVKGALSIDKEISENIDDLWQKTVAFRRDEHHIAKGHLVQRAYDYLKPQLNCESDELVNSVHDMTLVQLHLLQRFRRVDHSNEVGDDKFRSCVVEGVQRIMAFVGPQNYAGDQVAITISFTKEHQLLCLPFVSKELQDKYTRLNVSLLTKGTGKRKKKIGVSLHVEACLSNMKMVGAILEKYFDHDFVRTQVNVRTAKTLFLWERGLECLKIAYQNGFLEEFLRDKSVKPTKKGVLEGWNFVEKNESKKSYKLSNNKQVIEIVNGFLTKAPRKEEFFHTIDNGWKLISINLPYIEVQEEAWKDVLRQKFLELNNFDPKDHRFNWWKLMQDLFPWTKKGSNVELKILESVCNGLSNEIKAQESSGYRDFSQRVQTQIKEYIMGGDQDFILD